MRNLRSFLFFVLVGLSATQAIADTTNNTTNGKRNFDVCFSPGQNCDQKLINLINYSKKTLDIAIYSITLPGIVGAIESAANRGVAVRMVVDDMQARGNHSLVQDLIDKKIPLKIGAVSGIMHDKYTLVDGALLETGSFNYTSNATGANAENQIYLQDSRVIAAYQANFEDLWSKGNPSSVLNNHGRGKNSGANQF